MTAAREAVVAKLWRGLDPFAGFQPSLYRPDHGGWGSNHPYLRQAVTVLRPTLTVEIGVWNGASCRTLAEAVRDGGIDGAVIAVDTWLGSSEHWLDESFRDLHFSQGRSNKQLVFMTNVAEWNLTGYIVPLPLDSLNAALVMQRLGFAPDLIHLDGAHDYESVGADLRAWWPRLRSGGTMIVDDYYADGAWPGVRQATDEFLAQQRLPPIEHQAGKGRVSKP